MSLDSSTRTFRSVPGPGMSPITLKWHKRLMREYSKHSDNWHNETPFVAEVWSTIGQFESYHFEIRASENTTYKDFRNSVLESARVCVRSRYGDEPELSESDPDLEHLAAEFRALLRK